MEYIIQGKSREDNNWYLVYIGFGCDKKRAEETIERMKTNPDSSDKYYHKLYSEFRVHKVEEDGWWSDPTNF